jgi:hypothetical protein
MIVCEFAPIGRISFFCRPPARAARFSARAKSGCHIFALKTLRKIFVEFDLLKRAAQHTLMARLTNCTH